MTAPCERGFRRWRNVGAVALVVGAVFWSVPSKAVELELVLAIDASTSVDYREFNLQMAATQRRFAIPI